MRFWSSVDAFGAQSIPKKNTDNVRLHDGFKRLLIDLIISVIKPANNETTFSRFFRLYDIIMMVSLLVLQVKD